MTEGKRKTKAKAPARKRLLPGEAAPLPLRPRGEPITEQEALGVARRQARVELQHGRATRLVVPDELPPVDSDRKHVIFRMPPRLMLFVRARAEMEGRTVTDVVEEALTAYAESSPGTMPRYSGRSKRVRTREE